MKRADPGSDSNAFMVATAWWIVIALLIALAPVTARADVPRDQNAKCTLLTREEVEAAIGPHDGGKSDIGNQWSLQGCRWTSTAPKKGAPAGWLDSIEVAAFDPLRTSWAREQATGDPVPGMTGAKFDASYANLWFDCAGARFCVVNVRTASSAGREETARRLAQAVARRMKP